MSDRNQCPHCGQFHSPGACPIANLSPDDQAIVAYNQLLRETPNTPVTFGLVAINVLLFVLMSIVCMNLLSPPTETLVQFGADYGPLTLTTEPWRLITAMFVHIGIIHIAFNMYALWNIGPFAEKLLGSLGMLIAYFATGVVGSVASLMFNPLVPSAGASGAIFGIFGVVFGVLIGGRKLLPQELSKRLLPQMGYILVANLVLGFSVSTIDNAAHIGGLVFGCIIGFAVGIFVRRPKIQRLAVVSLIAIVGLAGSGGAYAYLAQTSPAGYVGRAIIATERFDRSNAQFEIDQITADQFREEIEAELLPQWQALGDELDADSFAVPQGYGNIETWRQMHDLRESAWRHRAAFLRTSDPADQEAFLKAQQQADGPVMIEEEL